MLVSKLERLLLLTIGALIMVGCVSPTPSTPTTAPTAVAVPTIVPTIAPTAVPPTVVPPTVPPAPTLAPTLAPTSEPTATPLPAIITSDPITGAPALARGAVAQRPYIVMIDNHPNAYPQSGLDHAAVVFEALAEFGLTRFMAVYAPGITPDVDQIGPVRSTRLYFVQWALPFNGLYVHAGGSPQGLALVENTDQVVNVDALFQRSVGYFWRDSQRAAPHNLYINTDLLARATTDFNVGQPPRSDIGFVFKADVPEAERPQSQTISYFFLYREDYVGWVYDRSTNSYQRLRRGRPAVDAVTGVQLQTKNIVAMEIQEAPIPGDDKGRLEQVVVGSGRARLFLDGVEREVTWRKDTQEAQLSFYDASGAEVQLNAGQVWIVALPSLDNLTVS